MQSVPALSLALSTWEPKSYPTSTYISYIDPTELPSLTSVIISATLAIFEETKIGSLYRLSQVIRGAEASLTIIEAQSILATATNDLAKELCTQAIFEATLNLRSLEIEESPYGTYLSVPTNSIFMGLFAALFILHGVLMIWLKYWYFGCCLVIGSGLEFAGYLTRFLATSDDRNTVYFLCQIIAITMAPAFTMAGVYYLLGKIVVVYGQTHSLLKPLWYLYIFILCDIFSLLIQAIGGALAASSVVQYENPAVGTHIMVAGIAFQVLSMSLFLWFLYDFLFRNNFKVSPEVRFSVSNFLALASLFPSKRAHYIREQMLEPYYDSQYHHIRQRKWFQYFPLTIVCATLLVYIRCLYRVIELLRGWTGYLYTHEIFFTVFESLMIFLTTVLLGIFHPAFFLGKDLSLPLEANGKASTDNSRIRESGNDKDLSRKKSHSAQESNSLKAEEGTLPWSISYEDASSARNDLQSSISYVDSEFYFH